jgi:hypothetical protein
MIDIGGVGLSPSRPDNYPIIIYNGLKIHKNSTLRTLKESRINEIKKIRGWNGLEFVGSLASPAHDYDSFP